MFQRCDSEHGNFFDYTGEMTRTGYLEVNTRVAKVNSQHANVYSSGQLQMTFQVILRREDFAVPEVRANAEGDWKEDTKMRDTESCMRDTMSYSL